MQQQSNKMATSLSQPAPPASNNNTNTNSGDAVVSLLPDVENFLADLQGRSAITGTVLVKQANLLEKIRAIHTTNYNHSNGHGRKESDSSSELTYDDTAGMGSRPPPLSTPTPSPAPTSPSNVIKSEEPIEYEDVLVAKKKTNASNTSAAKTTSVSAEKAAADAAHSGFLVKKNKSLLAKLTNGRKWCVLTRQGTFYCFEKNTSKTATESIVVNEFQCVPVSDELSKKQDFTFTLSNGKKTHTFAASSTEDFTAWMEAFNKMCVTSATSSFAIGSAAARPAVKPSAEDYSDANITSVDLDEENLYSCVPDEMVQLASKTSATLSQVTPGEKPKAMPERAKGGLPPMPVTAPPQLPPPAAPDDDEVLYDDALALPVTQARKSPVTPVKQKASDYEYEEEEVYDDAMCPARPPSASQSVFPASPPSVPNSPPAQPQLCHTPGMAKGAAICHSIDVIDDDPSDPLYPPLPPRQFDGENRDGQDLKNIICDLSPSCLYVTKWDWSQHEGHQLTFRRGQLLQVVSKQHEQHGWWVMTDGHVSGMVPCSYLAAALTAV